MQRKLIIRLRRRTTLLCHPELEGAFSAGTRGVSMVAGICTISFHGKAQEKTVQRKLIIKLRRSATLPCHPELEGAFSAGTKGVSITQQGSEQHLSFFLVALAKDQLLFP
jgi:hypothetical protein